MHRTPIFALLIVAASACTLPFPPRECAADSECLQGGIDGACVASPTSGAQWCAFPDESCTSGLRWGIRAGDGLTETCVAELPDAGVDASLPDACVPEPAEVCDGADNDCDTEIDEGCPAAPIPRLPWNGKATGSRWAPDPVVSLIPSPLRPIFGWDAVADATSYDIEIDDSCDTTTYRSCALPSPEVSTTTGATNFRPGLNLDVSNVPPVGRRYFWRVRACNAVGCSAWSPVRYVDIGRQTTDFDGDGYADLLVGAPTVGGPHPGMAFVFYGSSSRITSTTTPQRIDNPSGEAAAYFGVTVAALGDVNADGFSDAVIGACYQDGGGLDEGVAYVYYGSVDGLAAPALLENPGNQSSALFGFAVSWAGDLNADGYADAVIGAVNFDEVATDEGAVFIYYGSNTGITTMSDMITHPEHQEGSHFHKVSGIGDFNGDGFADVGVGAPQRSDPEVHEGGASIYFGLPSGLDALPALELLNPSDEPGGLFGSTVAAAGDLDEDGFGDVLCSAPLQDMGVSDEGAVFLYRGAASAASTMPYVTWDNPYEQAESGFGGGVASAGDTNGDGHTDVLIAAYRQDVDMIDDGVVYIYEGSTGGIDTTFDGSINDPVDQDYTWFGGASGGGTVSCGDIDGDGHADVAVGDGQDVAGAANEGTVSLFYGGPGGITNIGVVTINNPVPLMLAGLFGMSIARAH